MFLTVKGKKQWKSFLDGIWVVTMSSNILINCGLIDTTILKDLLLGLWAGSMTHTSRCQRLWKHMTPHHRLSVEIFNSMISNAFFRLIAFIKSRKAKISIEICCFSVNIHRINYTIICNNTLRTTNDIFDRNIGKPLEVGENKIIEKILFV